MLKELLARKSPIESTSGSVTVSYPRERFDLRSEVTRLLVERAFISAPVPLEELHRLVKPEQQVRNDEVFNDVTVSFYETSIEFYRIYFDLIKYIADEILGTDLVFQTVPTVRFVFPSSSPSSSKYRAKDGELLLHHCDPLHGHPFEEINCWLPLTKCYGTNALLLGDVEFSRRVLRELAGETADDYATFRMQAYDSFLERLKSDVEYRKAITGNCKPVAMEYGDLLFFDSRCLHSLNDNREAHTRVSLDFRVIPRDVYEKMSKTYSVRDSPKTFTQGSKYFPRSSSEIQGSWEKISVASRRSGEAR